MEKKKKLINQIGRFTIVGFICFGIDYGLLIFLTEVFGLNYLISNVISFTVSVIANYHLSTKYVFKSGSGQFPAFVALSVAGLGLNELIMAISPITYVITKIFATGVVMVFNFITRKWLLERNLHVRKEKDEPDDSVESGSIQQKMDAR